MAKHPMFTLNENVEEMFIGPFGSSLKNDCFVPFEKSYCMVYEQKHAIQKTMNVETRYVDEKKYNELKRFEIHGGDIIVSCRGTIGETFIVPDNAPLGVMHPSIMKIRLKQDVYNINYFNLLLITRLKKHEAEANGSGVKMAISATDLGKELFPVPTMQEQCQIAANLDKVTHTIDLCNNILEKLDLLVKSRFVEMFGDIETNSNNYPVHKLNNLCNVSSSKRIYQEEQSSSGVPFLRISNLVALIDNNSFESELFIPEEKYCELLENDLVPKVNDILVTSRGTLGKCYIMQEHDKFYFQDGMISWLYNIDKTITPLYLTLLFDTKGIKRQIENLQSGSTVAYLSIAMLKKLNIVVPPLDLQNQFAAFVEQTDKSKSAVKQVLEKAETLKKALMQEYFG